MASNLRVGAIELRDRRAIGNAPARFRRDAGDWGGQSGGEFGKVERYHLRRCLAHRMDGPF
ncbi:MAG: hypothetical protein M1449_13490 [Candidatus Thermoplasmatota archaeon]|nr:hypothetical protein [Candidatus Thermoplasmatota archaeon]